MTVSSEAVSAHKPRVEALAWRFVGLGGAEYDDLVQEGLIKVWCLLDAAAGSRHYIPGNEPIVRAMLDWVRKCFRQGMTGAVDPELL